jgi:hypothetical protein
LWKNGTVTNITSGTTQAEASGLDVYNGDVYIVGTDYSTPFNTGKVWKNGIPTVLSKDTFDASQPSDIKVINGDVYISGYGRDYTAAPSSKATYWKNGSLYYLSNNSVAYAEATGIFASNGDIYISGYESLPSGNNTGVYWKNGVKTTLNFPAPYGYTWANSIFIDNSDVYIAGALRYVPTSSAGYANACYWKNNSYSILTNYNVNETYIYSVFVKNNVVYTVGEHYPPLGGITPVYFQNNLPVPLSGYINGQDAYCNSVFVQ